MSIAELDVGAYGSADGPEMLDRIPPQDVRAEQSVLGGMLLSKDAIADAGEVVRSSDFYRPAHELIFDAIIDLFSRGEPVDAITVAVQHDVGFAAFGEPEGEPDVLEER